jgi:hypothetical protein
LGIPIYLWMKCSSARAGGRVVATGTAEAIVARSDAIVPEDMDAAIAKMIAVEQRELTG